MKLLSLWIVSLSSSPPLLWSLSKTFVIPLKRKLTMSGQSIHNPRGYKFTTTQCYCSQIQYLLLLITIVGKRFKCLFFFFGVELLPVFLDRINGMIKWWISSSINNNDWCFAQIITMFTKWKRMGSKYVEGFWRLIIRIYMIGRRIGSRIYKSMKEDREEYREEYIKEDREEEIR